MIILNECASSIESITFDEQKKKKKNENENVEKEMSKAVYYCHKNEITFI